MIKIGKSLAFAVLSLTFATSALAASAEALLARDLRAAKMQFGQEQRLYHYFDIYREEDSATQSLMNSPAGRRKIMQDRISYATAKFWTPASGSKGLFAGEGLYLAIDPSISESYGKMLIEFKVKPSTFYINLARGIYLQADTVKAIYDEHHLTADADYGIPDSMRISEMTLNMILQPENARFRLLLQKTLKAENIMMAEYIWRSDLDAVCGEDSLQTAFVYIGTDPQLPEFSSVEMADVKQAYPAVTLTAPEKTASLEAQKLISLIRVNQNAGAYAEKVQNALSIYKSEQSLHQALGALHGCSK
ncbi:hypothetical protein EZJ49_14200 [Bdellovibrio bacteriovorus]|uniref:hypothetical protein n=1 Tax=Bdellovibrio bacteriovorus TaxID=959 RepID=UPI0021CE5A48|nr:hypothetical protein [Bdellovibrio bacteriovorus]UXR64215.1 hypothetical protein EZJ49_14200 [Bdellovibrio bacteriovorus]